MNIIGANVVTRLGTPTRLTWLHTGSQHSWGSPFGQLTACHCCPTACSCRWSPVLFEMLALCSSCRSRAISWKQGCKVVVIVLKEVHINNAHLAFLCFRHRYNFRHTDKVWLHDALVEKFPYQKLRIFSKKYCGFFPSAPKIHGKKYISYYIFCNLISFVTYIICNLYHM